MIVFTRTRLGVCGAALVLTGCSALIGVNDIFLDDTLGAEDGGGSPDGSRSETGPIGTPDGGDASSCKADTTADGDNCGRCGHSCLGGTCSNSICQPFTVLNAAAMPNDFTLDDTYAYVTNYFDDTIKRVAKDGGGPTNLVTNWNSLSGIATADGKLFWTAQDAPPTGNLVPDGGDNNDSFGGVWSCTLPACTDKKIIQRIRYGNALFVKNGVVYSASEDGVGRVNTDGAGPAIINADRVTFGVAADDKNVYYISNSVVTRTLLDGGALEDLGSVDFAGAVALDDSRFFWTYSSSDATGDVGTVNGAPKATPGGKLTFGTKNVRSYGIASDGVNVYWANAGTYSDPFTPSGDGQVLTCPISGCPTSGPTVLVDKLLGPTVVRLDGPAVYVIEYGGNGGAKGRLLKVAKP